MPSFTIDENNVVTTVTSFDPVSPEQQHFATYDSSIIGKQYKDGAFYDVKEQQATTSLPSDNGSNLDEQ
ncbi:hypothetical protein ACPV3O_16825 [Vibrio rotiferianus]|uniref:hypothetical protein n=1 Tax=Vibrio rotiferianus TaxID=190895 RepID=UPI00406A9DBA